MTPAQHGMLLETIRLSRLRFPNDSVTLARLDEIEREANRLMETRR